MSRDIEGKQLPDVAAFSPPGPGYTNDSAIINVANGQPVVGPASVNQVKSEMGAAASIPRHSLWSAGRAATARSEAA